MSHRIFVTVPLSLVVTLLGATAFADVLQMGMDAVGWEGNNASGPLLYREVPESQLVSVRAKISSQTSGNWSQAGVIARAPNMGGGENWQISWSFRPAGGFQHQSNQSLNGVEAELNDAGLTAADLMYVRLDNLGGGVFQAFRGSGPNDGSITWTPQMDAMMMPQPQTNANLVGQTLQVGLAAGALGALPNANVIFDWVEIQTTSETFRDDFNYGRDLATEGVPPGGIWTGIVNAAAGGFNSRVGPNVGRCLICTWDDNGSGDFNDVGNWAGDSPGLAFPPDGNGTTVVFGPVLTGASATVFQNSGVTVKELRFDNPNMFALSGAGSITLEADSGSALINVLQGNHEIQVDLVLNDDVTATAAAGTSLNINTPVFLNGHTFTVSPGSTVNLNDGTVLGGAPGAGQLTNGGSLAGLTNLEGDFVQSASGSLAVDAGGSPILVSGVAELGGVLDVSLSNRFAPKAGTAYPVLIADRITNNGLTIAGAHAHLFELLVGDSNVSLLAVAIPEPATLVMIVAALAGAMTILSRRKRPALVAASTGSARMKAVRYCVVATSIAATSATLGLAQDVVEMRRDDFGDPAMPHAMQHDYTTGTVPAGKMWTGVHNPTNGGTPAAPAFFVADGFAFDGTDKAGKLHMEDLGTHPNSNATFGTGWEAQGDKNNAPFLFTTFSGTPEAQYDFDAVVKIDSQTAGNWSYAGIIARVAGPPVGICCGQDEANSFATTGPNAENHVTAGVFRTDAANPGNATMLIQNTLNGAAGQGDLIVDVAPTGDAGAQPIWLRLQKRGAQFTADSSVDGVTWFDDPATNNSTVNSELNVAGRTLEVGLSFMTFPGGVSGNADFDFFELKLYESSIPTLAVWGAAGSGNWNTATNWESIPAGTAPNFDTMAVELNNSITAPATVFSNTPVIAKSLKFESANKYAVAGNGRLTMQSNTGTSEISVVQGEHEIQLDLALANPTTLNAAAGTRLDINNTLDFTHATPASRTLTVSGAGRVNINNNIDLPVTGAVVTVSGGHVGGNGRINGRLTNNGGMVSPGLSVGTLTVDGNFQQNATGTLNIELGGTAAGQYDRLAVVGGLNGAILDGVLDVFLVNGFVPAVGNTFDVLTAAGGINNAGVISLHSSDAPFFSLAVVGGTTLRLTVTDDNFPPPGLAGDFNNDLSVDAADYVVWRKSARPPDDYNMWRANFGRALPTGSSLGGAAAVPEPNMFALLAVAIAAAIGINYRGK
jgi:hypothetical protein